MTQIPHPHFDSSPAMVAAWTGAGNVGILSVDYIRRKLNADPLAHIDMSPFVSPESVVVSEGVAHLPDLPQSIFYHHHNPDIVFFESNAHIVGTDELEIIRTILDMASELKTPCIYTIAALPESIDHTAVPRVFYACNNPRLTYRMHSLDIRPMPDGSIMGLNGLLLGFAASRNIDAVCLLSSIPSYATGLTYPRSALSAIRVLQRILGIRVDVAELENDIEIADPMFADFENKVQDIIASTTPQEEELKPRAEPDTTPNYITDRIEKLFRDAKKDRSHAAELKQELDRWNLYNLYENRFLDLFENEE